MNFSIHQYPSGFDLESTIVKNHRDYLNWPLVYFLEEKALKENVLREAYVGETTDVISRLKTHSKTYKKQKLSSVNLIFSELFNKSATLDIESNLIRYIAADGQYSLQNGNLGLSNHKYLNQKEVYWQLFNEIWSELRSLGIARHSLEHIDNSDLFKYSPYKSLSKEQVSGLKTILECLLDENAKVSLIQGGAGTGKSILAIFLFKLLKTELDDFNYSDFDEEDEELFHLVSKVRAKYNTLKMALVIPMRSFRQTIANVFRNIKGLSKSMVIGPSDISKENYDLIIVDEAHRLRQRRNLVGYKTFDNGLKRANLNPMQNDELDLIQVCCDKSILFYDPLQSIKPTDVDSTKFSKLKELSTTRFEKLTKQFRVKGGNKYVELINEIFYDAKIATITKDIGFYDFKLFESLELMINEIHKKEKSFGLSRMIAGFAWEWISGKNPDAYDIVIGDIKLKWNSITEDWVNSKNAINEVGCIHTTQGYDLNYSGIIIGPELDYDFITKRFIVDKDIYKDKNGKKTIKDDNILLAYVINIYKTILLRGIEGTYVYVCNPNLRKYLGQFISRFEVGNSGKETKIKISEEPTKHTVQFYDLNIAAGLFSDEQNVDKIKYLEMPDLGNHDDYFACKVVGESMNKVIPNGSICLFKKYIGGSRNGLITLVESSEIHDVDIGSTYTIKEYTSKKIIDEDGWKHEEIILKPLSTLHYEPIILRDEGTINFKVIGVFEKVLKVAMEL
ncbi:DNA/RNA helicase domain-containing protein [Sphingobacterium mizutaii]|uniref:DNA/RNA helicase domain-containing protein n=1 Tax=Sphingobacterium mizutaii TaxID=1010 RepID=UPI0016244474|nr:DNA/RNA helicase domain-containing protein [Sphingobacterium mizutaii]